MAEEPKSVAWPTDADVLANAKAAYAEVRAQIDHQIRNADAIDTKATAVITAVGVLAALGAPRLALDTFLKQASGAFIVALGVAAVIFCFLAIRPLADFAFGADPEDLIRDRMAERYDETAYALGLARALVAARRKNVIALDRKADWYARALLMVGLLLLSIAWLIFIGGLS